MEFARNISSKDVDERGNLIFNRELFRVNHRARENNGERWKHKGLLVIMINEDNYCIRESFEWSIFLNFPTELDIKVKLLPFLVSRKI